MTEPDADLQFSAEGGPERDFFNKNLAKTFSLLQYCGHTDTQC